MSLVAVAELAIEVWAAAALVCAFLTIFWPGNLQAPKEE